MGKFVEQTYQTEIISGGPCWAHEDSPRAPSFADMPLAAWELSRGYPLYECLPERAKFWTSKFRSLCKSQTSSHQVGEYWRSPIMMIEIFVVAYQALWVWTFPTWTSITHHDHISQAWPLPQACRLTTVGVTDSRTALWFVTINKCACFITALNTIGFYMWDISSTPN